MTLRLLSLLLLAGAFFLPGCSPDRGSPEEQVRELLRRAEEAAEERNLSRLGSMVSPSYADGYGNDRQALTGIVRYHFLRNEAVHLMVRVVEISFPEPTAAAIRLFVAMAGEPIPSPESIDPLRADLYRFDLSLSRGQGGEWLLVGARWGRAGPGDFF